MHVNVFILVNKYLQMMIPEVYVNPEYTFVFENI